MSKNEQYLIVAAIVMVALILKAAANTKAAGYFGVETASWDE